MSRAMKVYGWISMRSECAGRQTREIVAATSKAAAARASGYERPDQMFNLSETGNDLEIATAMASPGTVFWCGLDSRPRTPGDWHKESP